MSILEIDNHMSKQSLDLLGQKFGRLIVVRPNGRRKNIIVWLCKCVCGNFTTVRSGDLRAGKSKSCGCLRKETVIINSTTHGKTQPVGKLLTFHLLKRKNNE